MSSNNKRHEQLERVIFFTDAVFAIAITLLAIELKIPELHEHSETLALQLVAQQTPRFMGFFISFSVIGIYWISHHKIFGYIVDFDRKLLWQNLVLLMFIVLLPFTTGFYSEYTLLRMPFLMYSMNILMIGIFQARLLHHSFRSGLTHGLSLWLKRYIVFRGLSPGVIFMCMAIIQYFVPNEYILYSRIGMILIWIPFYFLRKYFDKKGVDTKNY